MSDRNVEETEEIAARLLTRAVPDSHFVHGLSEDIHRAALQRIGTSSTVPFQDMVIELRKLVRLLQRMLVPVRPNAEFVGALGERLEESAAQTIAARRQRMRWLMLGGVLGSVLSFLGVIAALLLRRRQDPPQKKKAVGTV